MKTENPICPYCGKDELKPYQDLYCCYNCGQMMKKDEMENHPEYICPYCDEKLTEEEAEDTSDCGCPSCRHIIDWEESEYPRYPKDLKS